MAHFERNVRVETAPFETDAILFNPDTNRFVKVNRTTAAIWALLEHSSTATQLAAALCEKFRTDDPERVVADVTHALEEMASLGLVTKKA